MSSYGIIKNFLKQNKWRYITGIIFIICVDILQLILPKVLGYITDDLQQGNVTVKILLTYVLIIIGISVLSALFRFLFRVYIFGTEKKLEYHIRKKLFEHLIYLPPEFYDTHKTGDLMAHATNDVNAVRMAMGTGILLITDTIFLTTAVVIMMFKTIDFRLTFFALIPLPVISLFAIKFGKIIHNRFTAVQEAFSSLTDKVQETLSGIRVVKAFAQENYELENFSSVSKNLLEKNMKLARLWGIAFPLVQLVATLSFVIVLGYGGIQVMYGEISLGDFVAFNTYLGMLVWPMASIGWVLNLLQRGKASLDRIQNILSVLPKICDEGTNNIKELQGHIVLKNVTFSYKPQQAPVLENINIDLPPGKILGITGRTGSGKTTLVNLILRLYELQHGEIFIDGHPIKTIPLSVLRNSIGYVPQNTFLFSTTIRENIAFGRPEADMKEIEKAAKIAEVYDNIINFPDGFDTVVGERGVTLSGGQKQRIAIARALIKNPKIIILDDALSAVDAQTEEKILKNLKQFMSGLTGIIISHRISAVKHADEIIFMEDGKIVERGNHDFLLQLDGRYANLYRKQLLEEEIKKS